MTKLIIVLSFLMLSCLEQEKQESIVVEKEEIEQEIANQKTTQIKNDSTILLRFVEPKGYKRTKEDSNSFANYLRNLPLKEKGSYAKTYSGEIVDDIGYAAVVDLPIGKKDLHQCADAVMRLRADYLFSQKRFDEIHFNLTNGMRIDYSEWMKGKRVKVNGNKTYWIQSARPSNTIESYWKYLEFIFTYAGTLSLSKELKPKNIENIEIGDVFIQGGSPGHAIIVVDMAIDKEGNKAFMLAQSYMPAQEIQILKNSNTEVETVWYKLNDFEDNLPTPDWHFTFKDLKSF